MTGSSHQRRIRRRLQERLSKRSEGRYPWLESVIDEPTVFCSECGQPSAIVRPGDWECRTVGCPENVADPLGVDQPEPRGEAEGALAGQELMNWDLVHEVHTEGKQFEQVMPPKKRRTLWNWLRKLVGR